MTEEEYVQKEKEYQEKIAEGEQAKANLVEELKAKREEARLAKEELEKAKADKGTSDFNTTDPTKIVEEVLRKKDDEASKGALETAKAEMKRLYNEFSEDTDSAGLVFGKFEKELSKFNLSGLRTKEEYLERLNEVYEFMNRSKSKETQTQFYSGTRQPGSEHKTTDGANITDAEAKLMKELGMDKERFLKIKEKRPTYVATLLKYRSN
jgi:hypothetical protein